MQGLQRTLSILGLASLAVTSIYAQYTAGSIAGSVTDPNGALVPGAVITATHEPTRQEFRVRTTEAGLYVFPNLPVGPYTLSAEQTGFKKIVQTGIEVRVGLRETIDLALQVGDVQQSVEVQAEVPLLETDTAQRGQTLSPQLLISLPIYAGGLRSAEAFLGYMPGVTSNGELSINGSIGRAREVEIDGASLTIPESGGTVFNFPGFEAFSQMNLVTSTYNAEYGRLGGGLETMTTKSGSNGIHGAGFWNMRRDIWDAAGWTSNQNARNPPGYRAKERFNEGGFTAGGPVYIPKIYDGRNRTFFFVTGVWDLRPASITGTNAETLPTALMRQGNFSEVAALYDPATTSGNTRAPFPGNLIPQSRWSKVSANIVPVIPAATGPGVTGNYQFISTSVHTDRILTFKVDHSITQNNRLAFFMTKESQSDNSTQFFSGPLSNGLVQNQFPDNYRVNDDYIIRPTLLLHTTFGFTRQQQVWNNPLQNGFASKIGLPLTGLADATPIIGFETDMPSPGLPGAGLGNVVLPAGNTAWGMDQGKVNNGGQWNWTTMVTQQLVWTHGRHEIKTGWDIRRLRTIGNDWAGTNGAYLFSRAQTALPTALTTTGNSFASFLLGAVDQAAATAQPVTGGQIRYAYQAGFVQDTWRLTPRLTLDLGLRYEVPIGWHDVNGNFASFNPTKPDPTANNLPGALDFMGIGAGRTGQIRPYPTDFSDIGPRLGFAYRISDKTVLRGGFGIYYETLGNGGCGCTDGFNGSFSQLSNGVNPAFNWDAGGVQPPAGFHAPPFLAPGYDNFNSGIYQMGPNYGKAPRVYNWSLTLQREVKNWLFEGAYVGNRARGLNSTVYLNQLPTSYLSLGSLLTQNITSAAATAAGYTQPFPGFAAGWGGAATVAQSLRPFPQYGTVVSANAGIGRMWYDSFQAKIERRFGNWQFMANYVFSKALDLMTYRQIFSQGAQVQAQDSYNLAAAKSYSPFDVPHVVNLLQSYQLPFGRGKRFLNSVGRFGNLIVGGWVISSVQQYRSGTLIEVQTPGNPLGSTIFSAITDANVTGQPIRTGVAATSLDPNNPSSRWFNSGAQAPFAVAPAFTLGNASLYYGGFRNPWFRNENVSLIKNFAFWESVRFQYRADAINIFNRTDFGGINGTVGNANFGRPTGVMDGPRIITMGLRLEF